MDPEEQPAQTPTITPFYNQDGRAIFYLYQGRDFYLYDGTPLAWLHQGENIYSYEGQYLGRLQRGWIYDLRGYAAFFKSGCHGGPPLPELQADPVCHPRGSRRARYASEVRPPRVIRISAWSSFRDESFFQDG